MDSSLKDDHPSPLPGGERGPERATALPSPTHISEPSPPNPLSRRRERGSQRAGVSGDVSEKAALRPKAEEALSNARAERKQALPPLPPRERGDGGVRVMDHIAAVLLVTLLSIPPILAQEPEPAAEPEATEPQVQSPGPMDFFIAFTRTQLAASGFERHEEQIHDQSLVWWSKGSTEHPTLVMIHGVADQAGTWFQVAPALAESRRVLLVDLPGHGESGPADGPLKMSTVFQGLETWLERQRAGTDPQRAETTDPRRAETKVTLAGNSMGAWLAALIAHRHPDWVEAEWWINGGPVRAEPQTLDGSEEPLDLLPEDREQARLLMSALRDPSSPATPDMVLDDLVRRGPKGPISRMFAENDDLEGHLLDGRLSEIKPKVHVVWGESDRFMGRDYPDRLVAGLPDAELHVIKKCGHLPQAECPQALLEALKPLLSPDPALETSP